MSDCNITFDPPGCCKLIFDQYPLIVHDLLEYRPSEPLLSEAIFYMSYFSLNPIYLQIKCGEIFCCEDLVHTIISTFTTFIMGNSTNEVELADNITEILGEYGFPRPFS